MGRISVYLAPTVTQEATCIACLLYAYYSVLWGCSKEQKQAAVWTKAPCYKGSKANSQIAHVLQHIEERGLRSSEIKNGQIFQEFVKESEASKIFFADV